MVKTIGEELRQIKTPVSKATSKRATMIEYFVLPLTEERREENFQRFKDYIKKNPNKTLKRPRRI